MRKLLPLCVLVLAVALLIASPDPGAAAEPVAEPVKESKGLTIGGEIGVAYYEYQELSAGADSDFDSEGPAWNLFARYKITDRIRIGLDWEAARINKDGERWSNVGTIAGLSVDQTNDLEVDIDMVDLDVSYALAQSDTLEFELVAGWHFLRHDFSRSKFALEVLSISFSENISPVSEDVDANGMKLGARLKGNFSPRYRFEGDFSWNFLHDVEADNSLLGKVDSEGNSFRWSILLGYSLSEKVELGLRYRGTFIDVDEGRSAIAVLPRNETKMHSFLATVKVRF
jgi:hypothetical protein